MLENETVIHTIFGQGKVLSLSNNNYLKVLFDCGEKTLSLETVIKEGFLNFENKDIQEKLIYEYIHKPQKIQQQQDELKQKMEFERIEKATIQEKEKESKAKIELLKIWKDLGFEGFLHTTEIENFEKIVDSGYLMPRNELVENHIAFNDSADQEVLAHTDNNVKGFCRFYYYFKTPTNYRANYQHPVILVFDEKLIDYDNSYFSSCNAAKNYNELTSYATVATIFPWDGIFERGEHSKSKYWNPEEIESSKWEITGMRNAEFLIKGNVNISLIKKIYFKSQSDINIATDFCPKEIQDKFCLDRSKFY